jgi:hypothetical protein
MINHSVLMAAAAWEISTGLVPISLSIQTLMAGYLITQDALILCNAMPLRLGDCCPFISTHDST